MQGVEGQISAASSDDGIRQRFIVFAFVTDWSARSAARSDREYCHKGSANAVKRAGSMTLRGVPFRLCR
jgi:hypothetical protein